MSANPVTGEIQLVSYNFVPRNYASCAGAIMAISQNTALFSLIGTIYGGDGRTSYGLPDLRGRAPVNNGRGPGLLSYRIGEKFGKELHTLGVAELPTIQPIANFTSTGSQAATATATATTSSTKSVAELLATTEIADSATPSTGAYLATATAPSGGADRDELIYKSMNADPSKMVKLSEIELEVDVDVNVNVDVELTPGDYTGHVNINPIGGGQSFSIVQPVLVLNYCIATQGIYPSRS